MEVCDLNVEIGTKLISLASIKFLDLFKYLAT